MPKPVHCKTCDSSYHYTSFCPRNRKPINKTGKHFHKWQDTRKEWIAKNPGPWNCYMCFKPLNEKILTLDHVLPRSRAPHLRYDMSNLAPCCWSCNSQKGSKVLQ